VSGGKMYLPLISLVMYS